MRLVVLSVIASGMIACAASPKTEVAPPVVALHPAVTAPADPDEASVADAEEAPAGETHAKADTNAGAVGILGEAPNDLQLGTRLDDSPVDMVNAILGGSSPVQVGGSGLTLGGALNARSKASQVMRISDDARSLEREETVARVRVAPPPKPPTRLTRLSLKATGLPEAAVATTFDRSDRALRACYEDELERNSSSEATVTIELSIQKDGRPDKSLTVRSVPEAPNLTKCLVKALSDMTFAHPNSEANVTALFSMQRPPVHLE